MIDSVVPTFFPTVQESIAILAVFAFALSGLAAAFRARLDFVGVCFIAGVSAFGGGTIRDLLLDRWPFFWVEQDHLVWLVILLCFLSSIFIRQSDAELTEKWIQVPDAVGLGLFAALGAQIALIAGSSTIVAILMGVILSTLGGVLRDTVQCGAKSFNWSSTLHNTSRFRFVDRSWTRPIWGSSVGGVSSRCWRYDHREFAGTGL